MEQKCGQELFDALMAADFTRIQELLRDRTKISLSERWSSYTLDQLFVFTHLNQPVTDILFQLGASGADLPSLARKLQASELGRSHADLVELLLEEQSLEAAEVYWVVSDDPLSAICRLWSGLCGVVRFDSEEKLAALSGGTMALEKFRNSPLKQGSGPWKFEVDGLGALISNSALAESDLLFLCSEINAAASQHEFVKMGVAEGNMMSLEYLVSKSNWFKWTTLARRQPTLADWIRDELTRARSFTECEQLFLHSIRLFKRDFDNEDWSKQRVPFQHLPHADLGSVRVSTLTFLNDDCEGGESVILPWNLPIAAATIIPPKKGRTVTFHSQKQLHAAGCVRKGARYAAVCFFVPFTPHHILLLQTGIVQISTCWNGTTPSPFQFSNHASLRLESYFQQNDISKAGFWALRDISRWLEAVNLKPVSRGAIAALAQYHEQGRFRVESFRNFYLSVAWTDPKSFLFEMYLLEIAQPPENNQNS